MWRQIWVQVQLREEMLLLDQSGPWDKPHRWRACVYKFLKLLQEDLQSDWEWREPVHLIGKTIPLPLEDKRWEASCCDLWPARWWKNLAHPCFHFIFGPLMMIREVNLTLIMHSYHFWLAFSNAIFLANKVFNCLTGHFILFALFCFLFLLAWSVNVVLWKHSELGLPIRFWLFWMLRRQKNRLYWRCADFFFLVWISWSILNSWMAVNIAIAHYWLAIKAPTMFSWNVPNRNGKFLINDIPIVFKAFKSVNQSNSLNEMCKTNTRTYREIMWDDVGVAKIVLMTNVGIFLFGKSPHIEKCLRWHF